MSRLNEHLWSGIIHRSETGESRKEDDVDLLDIDQFQEYLNDHYDITYYGKVVATGIDGVYAIRLAVNGDYNALLKLKSKKWYLIILCHPNIERKRTFLSKEIKNKYVNKIEDDGGFLATITYEINLQTNKDVLHFIDDFIKMPKPDDFDNEKMIKKVKN